MILPLMPKGVEHSPFEPELLSALIPTPPPAGEGLPGGELQRPRVFATLTRRRVHRRPASWRMRLPARSKRRTTSRRSPRGSRKHWSHLP